MEPLHIWISGVGGVIVMMAFTRFCPKEKLVAWSKPLFVGAAVAIDAVLMRQLPRKIAERIEEGIILSIAETISEGLKAFSAKLTENNKSRLEKK